ncbi:hypothetical protein G2W53_008171 [Senna tora]|uniref:Transposase n=1 Tax=Senna tora TaxID=362788 RepID=A0A834X8W6_9FABA|nr:hypothetical protein G2W53_008171 [Senna tora]
MGRSKRLRISQSESEAAAPAPARTPSSFSCPTVTPTPVPAPTPSQSTEPPPETTQHFTSSPTSAPIPDEVSKQCNRYWTIGIIGQRVAVPFNAQAQPVGEAAGLLSGFLGLVVTDVATFPISYHSWDKVPNSYKESCFNSIKGKFCLDRVLEKHFIIRKLGKNWRNYRCFLFGQFYQVEKTREQNLGEHSPKFIPLDMWAEFIDYRLDPKTKPMSEKNRENRSKLKMPHTCGSKSMARKKHEIELASEKPVSRGAVFVATHKRKDDSYVNDNAKIQVHIIAGKQDVIYIEHQEYELAPTDLEIYTLIYFILNKTQGGFLTLSDRLTGGGGGAIGCSSSTRISVSSPVGFSTTLS